jgi:hypothetical protein
MSKRFWILLLGLAVTGLIIHLYFWKQSVASLQDEDIFYIWLEGKRVLLGENPYARILAGDLRTNDKYATYFPLAYLFSTSIQTLGLTEFHHWIAIWRPLSYAFHLGIVAIILRAFQHRGAPILGMVAATIMLLKPLEYIRYQGSPY